MSTGPRPTPPPARPCPGRPPSTPASSSVKPLRSPHEPGIAQERPRGWLGTRRRTGPSRARWPLGTPARRRPGARPAPGGRTVCSRSVDRLDLAPSAFQPLETTELEGRAAEGDDPPRQSRRRADGLRESHGHNRNGRHRILCLGSLVMPTSDRPRIGILVVAYNATATLARTLDRIPAEFRSRISEVFVSDDASPDKTYLVGIGYQESSHDLPITVIRQRAQPRVRREPEGGLRNGCGARPRHHRAAARRRPVRA